jgi:DNA polymerase I-like protein with 3'-5' exonuclease and polymerase domains
MLDRTKAMCLITDWKTRLSEIEENLQVVFPPIVTERYSDRTGKRLQDGVESFNPGSRIQIAKRLISLGWKPKKFTEKGQVVVDETVLAGVDIPEAKLIAEYLLVQKRVSQVSSWLDCVQQDGRVHGKVFTNGAVTGRMTHNSPNMAQVPSSGSPWGKECRDCWIVPDGYKLVGIDASGLELRMLAHYMKDADYARAVVDGKKEDGTDIHTKNQIAAGLKTRDQAKTFIYAFLYGAGPAKIGSVVGGGEKEGRKLIEAFLSNTPALEELRTKVSRNAEKGWLTGLDGRHLQIRSAHAALNTLLQGAGAIVMKKALVLLDRKIKAMKLNAHFVANVHDEWQIEVAEADAEMVAAMGIQSIRQAGEKFKLNCPLDGEANIGLTWGDTH